MRITCKSLTEQGKDSLRQSISENKEEMRKYTFQQRKAFSNTWKEIILDIGTRVEYTLLLRARSGLGASYYITKSFSRSVNSAKEFNKDLNIEFDKMVNEIDTAMQKNGSQKEIDYIIEVLK